MCYAWLVGREQKTANLSLFVIKLVTSHISRVGRKKAYSNMTAVCAHSRNTEQTLLSLCLQVWLPRHECPGFRVPFFRLRIILWFFKVQSARCSLMWIFDHKQWEQETFSQCWSDEETFLLFGWKHVYFHIAKKFYGTIRKMLTHTHTHTVQKSWASIMCSYLNEGFPASECQQRIRLSFNSLGNEAWGRTGRSTTRDARVHRHTQQ